MVPLLVGLAAAGSHDPAPVEAALDALHQAAADADADAYFGLFTDDAIFIGTDPGERWTMPEFKAFAAPHFEEAPAWAYTPIQREMHFAEKGRVVWFYETVRHARYGDVRGSGVLTRTDDGWRIRQYVLSFPIPNDAAATVLSVTSRTHRLPTPYTAGQIRDAYVPGLVIVFEHRRGAAVSSTRSTVVEADLESVSLSVENLDADGTVSGSPEIRTHRWLDLQQHAAFLTASTSLTDDVTVTVPFGTLSTRRYEVRDADGTHKTFWFSPAHPGPPVRMTVQHGDDVVFEMVLVRRGAG